MTDSDLLRRFAEQRSEAAFTSLVQRHIDLVYGAALRQLRGDVHAAKDVTQEVFVSLARKAGALHRHPTLLGWLYSNTRFTAVSRIRREQRRQLREQEAHAMTENLNSTATTPDWTRVRSVLDEAMHDLDDRDRQALLLRFFERQPFAAIAGQLGMSENAVQKASERALDKLHAALSRRGVTSTSAALATGLAAHASTAAPAGLATSITSAAVASAGLGVTLLSFMNPANFVATACAATAVASLGIALNQHNKAEAHARELAALRQPHAALEAEVSTLKGALAAARERAHAAEADNAKLLAAINTTSQGAPSRTVTTAAAASDAPITRDLVQARHKRGRDLLAAGNWADAFAELKWCYEIGMIQIGSMSGVRASSVLTDLGKIAQNFPPAATWMRDMRDKLEQRMRASATDREAAGEVAGINIALQQPARNLALFDEFPAGDERRRNLSFRVYEQLSQAKRYRDAYEVKSYDEMISNFGLRSTPPAFAGRMPNAEEVRLRHRQYAITGTAKDVEVLAGAGQLAQAKELAKKVIALDPTPETVAILESHVTSAGQPRLLDGLKP
ncbi:MAG: sigma-70 family RNA polymerase sigma factor [Verrucomicrobiota bacterium]